jgi:hypothetical protein
MLPSGSFSVAQRTVILCAMNHSPFVFMYQPVLHTLRVGFEQAGATVRLLFGHHNLWPHSWKLTAGDVLVWVGIPGRDSEPMIDDKTIAPKCKRSYVNMLASVDEIWDYSLFNLHTCRGAALNMSYTLCARRRTATPPWSTVC